MKVKTVTADKIEAALADAIIAEASKAIKDKVQEADESFHSSTQKLTSEERVKIQTIIRQYAATHEGAPSIMATWDNIVNDEYAGYIQEYVVELGNSNPTFIAELESDFMELYDSDGIGFDTENNNNGFYGRTYFFYHEVGTEKAREIELRKADETLNTVLSKLPERIKGYDLTVRTRDEMIEAFGGGDGAKSVLSQMFENNGETVAYVLDYEKDIEDSSYIIGSIYLSGRVSIYTPKRLYSATVSDFISALKQPFNYYFDDAQ